MHGGAAHSVWWSWLAPELAVGHHVVALDLSGHGESGRRARYSFGHWADEVVAVAGSLDSPAPPVLVGHSLGGVVVAHAATRAGSVRLGGVALIDTPLIEPDQESMGNPERRFSSISRYATEQDAWSRFRPLPDQACYLPDLVRWVAERSVRRTEDGEAWTWLFDPAVFARRVPDRPADVEAVLAGLSCPVGFVVGGDSRVVSERDRHRMKAFARNGSVAGSRYVEIPNAGHHLMFDRPVELLRAVEPLLQTWYLAAPTEANIDTSTVRK